MSEKPNYNIKITNLLPAQALEMWPVLAPLFEKACFHNAGRQTIEDVYDAVARGRMMIHLIWDVVEEEIYAAVGSECFEYPRKKVFSLTMAGGKHVKEWRHLWPAFKEIGRQLGFDQIEVAGRAGWIKYLPGAREIGRTYVEDLEDGRQESED